MVLDFGELKNDIDFIDKITSTNGSIDKIEDKINKVVSYQAYDNLNTQERVKLDLFLSYASNSLFWMFLKMQGIDPNTHSVKNELSRIRQAMLRDKQVHDHKTIRPVLNKAAAGRFIRHELWVPKEKTISKEQGGSSGSFNRKRKFNDDDDVITIN